MNGESLILQSGGSCGCCIVCPPFIKRHPVLNIALSGVTICGCVATPPFSELYTGSIPSASLNYDSVSESYNFLTSDQPITYQQYFIPDTTCSGSHSFPITGRINFKVRCVLDSLLQITIISPDLPIKFFFAEVRIPRDLTIPSAPIPNTITVATCLEADPEAYGGFLTLS